MASHMQKQKTSLVGAFIDVVGDLIGTSEFAKDKKFIQGITGFEMNRMDYDDLKDTKAGQSTTVRGKYGPDFYFHATKDGMDNASFEILKFLQDNGVHLWGDKRKTIKPALLAKLDAQN